MATFRKRGNKWQARVFYYDNQGNKKQKAKNFLNKRDATKWASEIELYYKPGIDNSEQTFIDYFKNWYELYKKPSLANRTQVTYQKSIKILGLYFGKMSIKDITPDDVQRFINSYAMGTAPFNKPHARASVEKVFIHLKSALKKAVRDGIFRFNPADDIKVIGGKDGKSESMKYLKESDQLKLRQYIMDNRQPNRPVYYMILTALDTGMRLGELLGLTWDHISKDYIDVQRTWDYSNGKGVFGPVKNNNPRKVTINPTLFKLLNELDKRSFVFATKFDRPMSSTFVSKSLTDLQIKAGIEQPISFHGLRHSHASLMLYKGMNIKALQKRLGHVDIKTTLNTYSHVMEEMKKQQDDLVTDVIMDQYNF